MTPSYPWLFLQPITSHLSHYLKWQHANPFSIPCMVCPWVSCNRLCLQTRRPLWPDAVSTSSQSRPSTPSASVWHPLSAHIWVSICFHIHTSTVRVHSEGESVINIFSWINDERLTSRKTQMSSSASLHGKLLFFAEITNFYFITSKKKCAYVWKHFTLLHYPPPLLSKEDSCLHKKRQVQIHNGKKGRRKNVCEGYFKSVSL